MELKFLSEERLRLWRNSFLLFCKYKSFTGPFAAAGYEDYRFESKVSERGSGISKTPDIVATSSDGHWAVLDMTLYDGEDDFSKSDQLASYLNLKHSSLSIYGMNPNAIEPDVILCRLIQDIDIIDFCQLTVDNIFKGYNLDKIQCDNLKSKLLDFQGTDLAIAPQISICLLKEMPIHEIKLGLLSIIMQLFDPSSSGISVDDICEKGLDKMAPFTSLDAKSELCGKIKVAMSDALTNANLKEYIYFDGIKYQMTDKGKNVHKYTNMRNKIENDLSKWAKNSQPVYGTTTFSDFDQI